MLAEKLRAVLGQRRHAIARDLYDIYNLSERALDLDGVREALPHKVAARDLDAREVSAERMLSRREEFEDDWRRNLIPLVPEAEELNFNEIWKATAAFVQEFTPIRAAQSPEEEG